MPETAVMACPECHTMKMGPSEYKMQMSKCDACGGPMKEMKMM
ncbi:MAG: hypothetical protein OK452_09295 [Thaumarchaeota archaeon]|nr:hypothetical protein [Nitrososphaerota archaeon]